MVLGWRLGSGALGLVDACGTGLCNLAQKLSHNLVASRKLRRLAKSSGVIKEQQRTEDRRQNSSMCIVACVCLDLTSDYSRATSVCHIPSASYSVCHATSYAAGVKNSSTTDTLKYYPPRLHGLMHGLCSAEIGAEARGPKHSWICDRLDVCASNLSADIHKPLPPAIVKATA